MGGQNDDFLCGGAVSPSRRTQPDGERLLPLTSAPVNIRSINGAEPRVRRQTKVSSSTTCIGLSRLSENFQNGCLILLLDTKPVPDYRGVLLIIFFHKHEHVDWEQTGRTLPTAPFSAFPEHAIYLSEQSPHPSPEGYYHVTGYGRCNLARYGQLHPVDLRKIEHHVIEVRY